ncbi:hypothetical protein ED733_003062 [Metarhizium rileyi]|uniref:LYC1 C-terminal domain-containing protein n=1 Tax=Metarhizium rileyi (strain RCEF 4871) TaxID=1649241 RepID=A0A5C6G6P3_METRR|nr:hypothetical protein ED733_003062 [Metarhizium rileyi]
MSLPSAASESLILTKADPDERRYAWSRHQPSWGPRYTVQSYMDREERLLTCDLTKGGGLTSWILTDTETSSVDGPGRRPILSSVETYRKRAIVRDADGTVRDVTAHGIASVFTFDEFRRQGYAGRMLSLLGDSLAKRQAETPGSAEFSILFSDIGRDFYAKHQWMPFRSTHLSFPARPFTTRHHDGRLTLITGDNLRMIAALDEETLRRKMARPPREGCTTRVAILPDFATYEWHMARERFLCNYILGKAPTVHGALYTPAGSPESRVWMLWSSILYGGQEKPADNVVNILHYGLECEDISDEDLSSALRALMGVVHTSAEDWLCAKIDMWNPDERTQRLLLQMTDLQGKLVVREESNIASLRWFGQGSVAEVEWVDSQKYEWC